MLIIYVTWKLKNIERILEDNMQVIIPMSGIGQRFINAGYVKPKPLVVIDGMPIIEHVVALFPKETNFFFICNSIHLKETNMRDILKKIAPKGRICEIHPHKKGPVHAVVQILDLINKDEEVIVNYCDFSTYWSYQDFLKHTRKRNADGAIPAYKGFHPHMLGSTNYAFMREDRQWMLEIKEKEPFTNNRNNEYASNGTYYFKTGEIMAHSFLKLIDRHININGEFYVSLAYNILLEDKLKVSIYEVEHMLQWGTPADVEEYRSWSNYFTNITSVKEKNIDCIKNLNIVMPMAGKGSRFANDGYLTPKPYIEISGKAMVEQSIDSLPDGSNYYFVSLKQYLDNQSFKENLNTSNNNLSFIEINEITDGQACTAELAINDFVYIKSIS